MSGLLDMLAAPQDGYPIIHVAGTNGKTSTSRMAAALVSAHGLVPGLFTSPHLQRIEERFDYGLNSMTADEFAEAMGELAPIADHYEHTTGRAVTYFELTAALAFSWFATRSVDAAIVETGLGGRLDATNAATSDVAVVTSIGLEHTEYLGTTITEIAGEKLAILDEGATLVTGDLPDEALDVAHRVVQEQGATWFQWGRDIEVVDPVRIAAGWRCDLRTPYAEYTDIELRLHGRYQTHNFAVAVAAVESLFGRALDEAGVREAAGRSTSPGRLEIVDTDPLTVLDGAHNPHAMVAMGRALREEFPEVRWQVVFGVMADKDAEAMLQQLDGVTDGVHVAAAATPRARPAEEVGALVREVLEVPTEVHATVAEALAAARRAGEAVLVTGSIYVVGEARNEIPE